MPAVDDRHDEPWEESTSDSEGSGSNMMRMKRVRVLVCVAAVGLGSLALGGCFGGGYDGCPTVYSCNTK